MLYNLIVYVVYFALLPIYRLKVKGAEKIPEGAAVVCGNHTARVDAVVLFLALFLNGNRPAIIGKSELFRNPIARWFFTYMGAFPVDRGKADLMAIKKALTVLKQGQKLIIFPEGTRVKEGMSGEAKSGAAMMAVRTGSPVLPVYITPGRKAFRGCTVTFGDPFCLPKPEKGEHDPYKKGADQIMEKIWEIGKSRGEATPRG